MRIISVAQKRALEEAVLVIQHGGVVAHPTETCYGLACDLTNEAAVRKLFALKKRPEDQPVSALFPSIEEAKKWVEWNDLAEQLARKHLPGPLTIVLPLKKGAMQLFPLPLRQVRKMRQGNGKVYHLSINGTFDTTIGVRISSHPAAQKLAEPSGVPLSTTSANLHGKPETYSVAEILEQFEGEGLQPDLILDSGILPRTPPSTIVDLTENTAKILRQGSTVI